MDASAALDALRSRLEASFGKAMAMMVLMSASNASATSLVGITESEFSRLAEAVGRDQRVIDMWGTVGASEATSEWKALVA